MPPPTPVGVAVIPNGPTAEIAPDRMIAIAVSGCPGVTNVCVAPILTPPEEKTTVITSFAPFAPVIANEAVLATGVSMIADEIMPCELS